MRLKPLVLCLAAALGGCSYEVTTPNITVGAPPPAAKSLSIGAVAAGVDVAEAEGRGAYSNFRNDFYSILTSESGGLIAAYSRQPLQLLAALKYKVTSDPPGAFIGVLSCYIPPLGFIPYDSSENYTVAYSVRDRDGRIVYSKSMDAAVGGTIKGWFVARINAQGDLHDLEAPFVAKNAARLVIQDVFEHAAVIVDAAKALAGEAAAAKAADGVKPADWWSK